MGIQEALNYALYTNPLSSNAFDIAKSTITGLVSYVGLTPQTDIKMVVPSPVPLWKLAAATGPYVRLAAFSGALAVVLGAYGSHRQYPKETARDSMRIFETANRYHFIHTLALLGLPLCRASNVAGVFMVSGILMFCGPCYYFAFTSDKRFSKVTPFGGTCFILGWLAMLY
ncbi:transmembrane protein 256 [Neodiprion pinetum]|uniref:Transmembrane protein 256 n=1 Tax=Neodiprion lecontei TaxID=441921 RepID=A0ABM3FLW2_NEOLC|nr:transmembrane protein 256-like [Neodiprion fabricii]XP_046414497.1 transmembrane protein 256-like [Neodiprion fabricii]XP_046470234.1 transmembrane protein 256-like [Neodiprion pinetum]XP_046588998.1 transmembrane protein 256 [Neodiprion lecontei]XP_046607873.1 transmembrane protein 256-like [Neodiprion virginianus]XP_046607874.1 transmembrane protein 256-like [Neodiprion virginianus]